MDTAAVPVKQQQAVGEQEVPLEAEMFQEVRALYMEDMQGRPDLRSEDIDQWFRCYFATVAHRHQLIHHKGVLYPDGEQRDDRNRYNLYFRLVLKRFEKWFADRLASKKKRPAGTVYPSYHTQPSLFPGLPRNHDRHHPILKKSDCEERREAAAFDEPDPRQIPLFPPIPDHFLAIRARIRARVEARLNKEVV